MFLSDSLSHTALTFSVSWWASSVSSWIFLCFSMAMSGLPWAWASRSRAMCSLRQAFWNADLAFSSCHKKHTFRSDSCRPGVSIAHSIHSFSKMHYSTITICKHLYRNIFFLVLSLQYCVQIKWVKFCITFFSLLAQGFWAREKPVSKSWDSLKPPNIFLWKVSFCHVRMRSPSSDTRARQMEECSEERRSAEERKHCHARNREP